MADEDRRREGIDEGEVRPPRNVRLVLEYDGAAYVGWEKQKNGLGIQQVVEEAIHHVTGEWTTVNGSGRTDAGVHAFGQVASFTLEHPIAVEDLHRALNALLPEDVAVLDAAEASLFFHARFSAKSKVYRYLIRNSRVPSPLRRASYHAVYAPLDVGAMRRAARHLVGRHDFAAFCRDAEAAGDCTRTVFRLDVEADGPMITLEIEGDGFLYNMVRIIAGTLVHVGLGKIDAEAVPALIAARDRKGAGPTLPARGLALVRVSY